MSPFLVHETVTADAATHALIIGVGEYPYLLGGSKAKDADFVEGMGQLSSPPISARAFADWLILEHYNPEKPLGTVALLLSEAEAEPYENPITKESFAVERALMEQVKNAVRAWKVRGDAHDGNQLIFYFCGHGIADGGATTLLLENYGEIDDNPLEGAIDFSRMRLGLASSCKAREQLYIVDACRVGVDTVEDANGFRGDPIVAPKKIPPRARPVLYSTVAGAPAYGRKGVASYFTDSLLRALRGGGADNYPTGKVWSLTTTRVKEAIDTYMDRLHTSGKIARELHAAPADDLSTFALGMLPNGPSTPVCVTCSIPEANAAADMHYLETGGAQKKQREVRAAEPWEVTVTGGKRYHFCADFPDASYAPGSEEYDIRPPAWDVKIPVTKL